MNEPSIQLPSVTVTVTQHRSVPGLLVVGGEPPTMSAEATVEVTVTGPDHAAVLLNAAAFGADQALRATDPTHPAHITSSAQCGRTFVHARHETTEGTCYGLDGTEVSKSPLIRYPVTDDDVRAAFREAEPFLTEAPEPLPFNVYEVPAEALHHILETDARQSNSYGKGVRDTLVHLRLITAERAVALADESIGGKRARR